MNRKCCSLVGSYLTLLKPLLIRGVLRRLEQKHKGIERTLAIQDQSGITQTDQASISEVFAQFYEHLYRDTTVPIEPPLKEAANEGVTEAELRQALRQLKGGKTGADDGLVAEMLKTGHAHLVCVIAEFFSQILNGALEPPEEWKLTKFRVLFKKGDPSLPKNYRPIAILPVMAKLFSTVLYNRLAATIDSKLSKEQFGFRPKRGCADAIHIVRTVIEKSLEWGEELWVATLDVEKAFDRVHHSALFSALLDSGISISTVCVLRRLYHGVRGYVSLWDGAESRPFDVQRGVKQGDPLSPALFNLVLDKVLSEVSSTWNRRGYGTLVGQSINGKCLTHVAFADDQTLIARSWISMKRMILMLRDALAKVGLDLHPTKCKVQTNRTEFTRRGAVVLTEGFSIEILEPGEHLELLGTSVSLEDPTGQEVENRIACVLCKTWV